jgi:O-antigen biosynthesis protein WbqP
MYLMRLFDIFLSLFGLICTFPVLLILVVFSFLDTGAPIFQQKRLGKNQKPFMLIKFRTMRKDTASMPTHLVNPSAATTFGRFLRRTKLDELPQLWNVLKGEMSLVGPRPGLPNQDALTKARAMQGVFLVKPGITGFAQISGIDMSTPELLARTDAQMIAEMSVTNYFRFIFLTVIGDRRAD